MPSSMSWFQSIRLRRSLGICFLAIPFLLGCAIAAGQDQLEQRYQQALELFNSAKMEDACEQFQVVEQEKPGYKETKKYLGIACNQVKRIMKMEEDLFNQGVQFFNQGNYDDAKQKFEQASKIPLKNPKYRSQISRYLRDMEARQNEERLFQEGVRLFNDGKYDQAQSRMNQVAQGGGPKAGEARNYLARIQAALSKQRAAEEETKVFNEGVQLFNAKNYANAYMTFDKVANMGGPRAGTARDYLKRIEEASKPPAGTVEARNRPPERPKPAPEITPPPKQAPATTAGDQALRAGLQAYFEGKLDDAERDLSDYISGHGSKQGLAYFFRGASYSTRYYLSGEKDRHQRDLAVADFRALRDHAAQFQPPQKFVSPKIVDLYREAVGATSP